MKIHYLSCHSILEYDEFKLLTELGHDVFSNGAYLDPSGHISLPRPGVPKAIKWSELIPYATDYPRTNLPNELIDPFDVIVVMHTPELISENWPRIKHKRVIWRTIGQSVPATERRLKPMRTEGLQIIRYSPKEENIEGFIGSDALIRFYKDPGEYCGWVGNSDKVINFTQTLKGRGAFVHYDEILGAMAGYNSKIYGSGNEDLGMFNGGEVSYKRSLEIMREARVYVYGGTWPASYTLSFIEAWMLGIPVVAIGKGLAHLPQFERLNFYEVDELIEHGVDGFIANTVPEMRLYIAQLLNDYELAQTISKNARKKALAYFGRDLIANQWAEFLRNQ